MLITSATYQSLEKEIRDSCPTCTARLMALDVVFARPTINKLKVSSVRGEKAPKSAPQIAVPAEPPAESAGTQPCQMPGCETRVGKKAKDCAACTKRVCSAHWDRKNDSCKECAAVPA